MSTRKEQKKRIQLREREVEKLTQEIDTDSSDFDEFGEMEQGNLDQFRYLSVENSLKLVSERRTRRRGWIKLLAYLILMSLYIIMAELWTNVGLVGQQKQAWSRDLKEVFYRKGNSTGSVGKLRRDRGAKNVTQVDELWDYLRAEITEIYVNRKYGYQPSTTSDRTRGDILTYSNVLRFVKLRRTDSRMLTGTACESPTWAADADSIWRTDVCIQAPRSVYGAKTAPEDLLDLDLDMGLNSTLLALDAAENSTWINQNVREVSIDVWAHNPQTTWTQRVQTVFTFPIEGGINFGGNLVVPLRLYPYVKGVDFFIATLQVGYIVFLVVVLFLGVMLGIFRLFKVKRMIKLQRFFENANWLDLGNAVLGVLSLLSHGVYVSTGGRDQLLSNDAPQDFQGSWIPEMARYTLGLAALGYSWRMLQFMEFDSNLGMFLKSLKRAWNTLTYFLATLVVIITGYAIGGFLIIGGTGTQYFDSVGQAFQSCLMIASGTLFFSKIRPTGASHWATILAIGVWYWSFIVLVFFILVNIFVALILDAYSTLRYKGLLGVMTYGNLLALCGEGVRIVKQTLLTWITFRPNGRITQVAEDRAFLILLQQQAQRESRILISELTDKLEPFPGGENLVRWLEDIHRQVHSAERKIELEMHRIRQEAREIKRARRLQAFVKHDLL